MLLFLQFFFPKKLKKIVSFVFVPSTVLPLLLQAKARTRTTQVKRLLSQRNHECSPFLSKGASLCPDSPHPCPPLSSRPPQRVYISAALHGCECSAEQAYCKHCARWPLTFDPQGASDTSERRDSGTRCRASFLCSLPSQHRQRKQVLHRSSALNPDP